jgi:hypothetical protein
MGASLVESPQYKTASGSAIYVNLIGVSHHPARHGKLVVRANPAKNPKIVDGHIEPRFAHRRHENALVCLAIRLSERQTCEAKNLIICEPGRWNYPPDVSTNCSELIRDRLPFSVAMPEFTFDAMFTIALYE